LKRAARVPEVGRPFPTQPTYPGPRACREREVFRATVRSVPAARSYQGQARVPRGNVVGPAVTGGRAGCLKRSCGPPLRRTGPPGGRAVRRHHRAAAASFQFPANREPKQRSSTPCPNPSSPSRSPSRPSRPSPEQAAAAAAPPWLPVRRLSAAFPHRPSAQIEP
jgi:hypothetical protein